MLVSLAIRNVVLIDRIDLTFRPGLCVLTGETGAGKSILLESLGLALGERASAAVVRRGPQGTAGPTVVTAEFSLPAESRVNLLLQEHGLDEPGPGEGLFLRRTVTAEGRSRAFVNDQPVSIAALRHIGQALIEIEGQFASQGLMDPAGHLAALDSFAGLDTEREAVVARHRTLRDAEAALAAAEAALTKARSEEDYLRHVAAELAALDARPGEEQELSETRALLMNAETLIEDLNAALAAVGGTDGPEAGLGAAQRILAQHADKAAGKLDAALAALDRAASETADALAEMALAGAGLEPDPQRLEAAEERLFALRGTARKHNVRVDELPALAERFEARIAGLDSAGEELQQLRENAQAARTAYTDAAEALSGRRRAAAVKLDAAIAAELPPLKLEKARFHTVVETLEQAQWSADGIDDVHFEISTNPAVPPGPLARIASGGELARFLLALKVVLQHANAVPTLIFDEVDTGIGGATASAVGARLALLGATVQVIAVTHSPQVAAYGMQHLRVVKSEAGDGVITVVDELSASDRREEIARMLAGARVTDEARAAADNLIAGRRP